MQAAGQDRLLEHNYDGIQEYDNPLPRWWVIIFWITIVFSLVYFANVPGVGIGAGRIAAYNADMAPAHAPRGGLEPGGGPTTEQLTALVSNPGVVSQGKQLFTQNCAPCHR